MYSPYDQRLEQLGATPWLPGNQTGTMPITRATGPITGPAGAIIAGTTAMGMALGGGAMIRKAHNNAMKSTSEGARWYQDKVNKVTAGEMYHASTSPLQIARFLYSPHTRELNFFDKALHIKGYEGKVSMFAGSSLSSEAIAAGKAEGSLFSNVANGTLSRKLGKITISARADGFRVFNRGDTSYKLLEEARLTTKKVVTAPMLTYIMALNTVTDSFNEGGPNALSRGVARAVGENAGMGIGSIIGAGIGNVILPGFGGIIGSMVGGMIGAGIGGGIPDKMKEMQMRGRQLTTPDLGGAFRDTFASMTMRQRSMSMISTSQFNIRNSMGREAYMLRTGG